MTAKQLPLGLATETEVSSGCNGFTGLLGFVFLLFLSTGPIGD